MIEYNENMGAVDKCNMMLGAIKCTRKTIKWYKKIFFHLVDIYIYNSHILYDIQKKKNTSLADFQLELIGEIFEKHNNLNKSITIGRAHVSNPLRLTGRHFINKIPTEEGNKQKVRRCAVCSKNKVRKETSYYCKDCNAPLCVIPCFEIYHSKRNY